MTVVIRRRTPHIQMSRRYQKILSVFQNPGKGSVYLVEGIGKRSGFIRNRQ